VELIWTNQPLIAWIDADSIYINDFGIFGQFSSVNCVENRIKLEKETSHMNYGTYLESSKFKSILQFSIMLYNTNLLIYLKI